MEVRRRKAGGAGSSSSSSSRNDAEVVRTRPSDVRSQWSEEREASTTTDALSSALSTALTSLGGSPLVTFIIDLVKQAMNMLWTTPATSPTVDPRASQLLAEFRDYTTVRYDPANPKHEEQLLHLWACSFPQTSLDERVSDQWKHLGFQGRDPATDFRGCGVFGLQQIIAYAEKYPETFQFHLKGQHHEEAYPFAITAINLVNLIFQLLGWGMRPSTSPAKAALIRMLFAGDEEGERRFREGERWRNREGNNEEDEREKEDEQEEDEQEEDEQQQSKKRTLDAFSEVFVATFNLFDKEWRSCNAHYMDFPKVIASTQTKLEAFLQRNRSVDDVVHYNYTNNMALRK